MSYRRRKYARLLNANLEVVAFPFVLCMRQDLQIVVDVQSAHAVVPQWHDVIDHMRYAGFRR